MAGNLKSTAGLGFVVLAIATTMAVGEANTIVVGGAENWRFGYNYTDWALKNSPFYIHDTLGEYFRVYFLASPPNQKVHDLL